MDHKTIEHELARINAAADRAHDRSQQLLEEVHDANRAAKQSARLPWSIQRASANRKLSPIRQEVAKSGRLRFVPTGPFVISTYASISATCPRSCGFKDNGCYAQAGASHLTMRRLDLAARGYSPLEVTRGEASALATLFPGGVPQDGAAGGRDLRLHVGGEASCQRGARALADAVEALRGRGLRSAWTFTHRWRQIDREAWGPISVLASCETQDEAAAAIARGYAPAITIAQYASRKAFSIAPGIRGIPCPYEAEASSRPLALTDEDEEEVVSTGPRCVQCRLCLDRDLLRMGGRHGAAAIVFAAHGAQAEQVKTRLRVIQPARSERQAAR